jgi:hypothetical protein
VGIAILFCISLLLILKTLPTSAAPSPSFPRNSCNEALTYAMDKGRLVPCDSANETVELYLLSQDILRHPIDMIRTADIVTYAAAHGVGRSKAYTYIEKLIDSAKIERVTAGGREKGMYRRVIPS